MAMPLLASMLLKRRPAVRPVTPQTGPVTQALAAVRTPCDPLAVRNTASLLGAELDTLRARVDRVTRILDCLENEPLFTDGELASIGGRL